MPTDIKHPEVVVKLSGQNGNVFGIIGAVTAAMKKAGLRTEATQFTSDAMSSESYNKVLQLCMKTVTVK